MYIPDFWCGVIVGALGCIVTLILIAIANKATRKK